MIVLPLITTFLLGVLGGFVLADQTKGVNELIKRYLYFSLGLFMGLTSGILIFEFFIGPMS